MEPQRKRIEMVRIFFHLGLERPRAWDHKTKLEQIKTKGDIRVTDVFAEHRGSVFLFRN